MSKQGIQLNAHQASDLSDAANAALVSECKYGMPALVTLAQWALESGWGRYQPGNNCFGIKQYKGCYGFQELWTHEYIHGQKTSLPQKFATFPDLVACFSYHAQLITSGAPYQEAWQDYEKSQVPEMLVGHIAGTYAPGNLGYSINVTKLMRDQTVLDALAAARIRAAQSPTETELAGNMSEPSSPREA